MIVLVAISQVVIALGILNVWILRFKQPTRWRPDGAQNMRDEFAHYGFPSWFITLLGGVKILLAILLLVGLGYQPIAAPAAAALGALMLAAVIVHIRVRDPLVKSVPALSLLLLCCIVIAGHACT